MSNATQPIEPSIEPFRIAIPDADLIELRQRLARVRLAPGLQEQGWHQGVNPGFLYGLLDYWARDFDWRTQEARLNALPQYLAQLKGRTIHFVHQPGKGPAPLPLVLTHGWPGSFIEFEKLIPLLADPGAHGADPADAFHVVVPSLPGYAFSPSDGHKGTGTYETAALWAALMTQLGYERFGAQGGDLGSNLSSWLGIRFPERLIGMHLNYIPTSYQPPLGDGQPPLTPEEQAWKKRQDAWKEEEGAYRRMHATKPYTAAAGLNDSPAGLAAWIAEKFHAWSDDFDKSISLDTLLTDISLYWFTQTIFSSFQMYVEDSARPVKPEGRVQPPIGVAAFPSEIPMPPRSWAERCFDVRRWTEMPAGGHFAALEQPQRLAEEIRAFFRPLREA
ncbi:epoxide hydrolase family protein [Massilia sp. 9096]|uniref:epoxide hydrolase family protein n=1 Tax=Massilia sp. 9096 TaxID=1500894 RepID=UPI0005676D56|nr:epoxide hydrolase family protein [Massilia sp. 9096]